MYFVVAIVCLIINSSLVFSQFRRNDDIENDDQESTTLAADLHSFVVLIEILFTDGFKRTCAGTIIHENVVITAAHCFLVEDYENVQPELSVSYVVLGTQKMHESGFEQYLPIERIVLHPQFKGWTADIALVYTFVDMTFERPGQILPLLEEELPTQIDSNLTIVSWAKFGYVEKFQPIQGKPSTDCPDSRYEDAESEKPKKNSRFGYEPLEESLDRRHRSPKSELIHKLRDNKERNLSEKVIDDPRKGIENIIRQEVSKYGEVDKDSEIPNESKNFDLDKYFDSRNNYTDFSEFKGLGLRKGIGTMKAKIKSNKYLENKYSKNDGRFGLRYSKNKHKENHEKKKSRPRRKMERSRKKKFKENFIFKSFYLGQSNSKKNKPEEHTKLIFNPYISNTESRTKVTDDKPMFNLNKTNFPIKLTKTDDNQIEYIKSINKNWRRQMGGLELKLAFEIFGFVNSQVCKKVIERAQPNLFEKINGNDVLCYASQNHILTDADAGAPALYRDRLMAVTLGSLRYEGQQMAMGMRVSCFCGWIADNLPNGGNKLACCRNCCTPSSSDAPTNKVSSYVESTKTWKRHWKKV